MICNAKNVIFAFLTIDCIYYMTRTKESTKTADHDLSSCIIEALQDKKAQDVVEMDLSSIGVSLFDKFIICTATSNIHADALTENVYHKVKEKTGIMPNHIEGTTNAQWILMDYFDTVVHIFLSDTREYYALERLWADAAKKEYANL